MVVEHTTADPRSVSVSELEADGLSVEDRKVCSRLFRLQLRFGREPAAEERNAIIAEYEALVDLLPPDWQRVYRGRFRINSFIE